MPFQDGGEIGFGDPILGGTQPTPHEAKDIGDAIIAGLQSSAMGLAIRRKLPEIELSPDARWYERVAAGAANITADLPLAVAGAVGGAAAGTAVAPGPGTVVGGGAGALAVPMAIREALVKAYSSNHAASWDGIWEITKAGFVGGLEGAVIGGVTAGAGRAVVPLVAPVAGRAVSAGLMGLGAARMSVDAAGLGAELATLTTASSALQGRVPEWHDFMDNAILLGGMKGAVAVAKGMRSTYAETGRIPEQVFGDAQKDPKILEQLRAGVVPAEYGPLALEQRVKAALDADPRPETIRENLLRSADEPGVLNGDVRADPVKYEYVNDAETSKEVLRAVSQMYENEITQRTRGVVSNKATATAALKQVSDGAIAPAVVGEAGNAAEIYARAHMLRGAANHAVSELEKLAGIPEADITPTMKISALAALERVAMLKRELEGVGAEAGRSLQILRRIKYDPDYLGEAQNIIALAERKGSLQDVAAIAKSLKDPAQLARFAEDYTKATTTEKVLEAWKAAILSGPQTHLANVAGNMMKWFVEIPESTIAATLTAARRAMTADPMSFEQYKARALAPLYGIKFGALDAVKTAAEVWQQSGERLEKADVYRGAIEGRTGEIVRLPFKALQVEDALFRTLGERAEAHIMAVDRATQEGFDLRSQAGRERVALYTTKPEFGLPADAAIDAFERVQKAGAEAVFSQQLGERMAAIQRAMQGHWTQFIMPFFRTPANLVSWAIQHVPGLNLVSSRWREDFAAGGERQDRAISRVIVGAALTMTAYEMAQNGQLTGSGLFSKEENNTKRGAGWQPYSLKIGEKYYSFQRIEPVAKVLGLAADYLEMSRALQDEQDQAKLWSMLVLMFGNATVSTTYLSGLSNAIQSIADPARYGENFLEQYASSLVPKAIGQPVTAADPYQREVNGVLEAIQSQLPFLREKLLPKRDIWGEPVKGEKLLSFMPVAVSQESQDKVKQEAVRLHLAIANAPKFLVEKGPFNAKDQRMEYTEEQRDVYQQTMGHNAMEILAPIVNAPDWEQIPDFAKAAIYRKVFEGTRKQGAYAALPPDEAARAALRERIVDKILQEIRATQQP